MTMQVNMKKGNGKNSITSKQFNRGLIFQLIATGTCNTRIELSRRTGLAKTTVTNIVAEFLEKERVMLQPEFELATSDMLIQFAKRSLGVASVVEDFAKQAIREGELFELQFDKEIPKREFCIVYNDKIPMSTAAGKLFQTLTKQEV